MPLHGAAILTQHTLQRQIFLVCNLCMQFIQKLLQLCAILFSKCCGKSSCNIQHGYTYGGVMDGHATRTSVCLAYFDLQKPC